MFVSNDPGLIKNKYIFRTLEKKRLMDKTAKRRRCKYVFLLYMFWNI